MRQLILLVFFLMATVVNTYGQSNDTATLKKLNEKFLNAIVNRDTAALSSVLADDFMLVNPGGQKNNKAHNLANATQPDVKVVSIHIDSVEARMINEKVGTITAWTTFNILSGGKQTTGKNCYQDVYVKTNNEWKAISAHVTLLSMK